MNDIGHNISTIIYNTGDRTVTLTGDYAELNGVQLEPGDDIELTLFVPQGLKFITRKWLTTEGYKIYLGLIDVAF